MTTQQLTPAQHAILAYAIQHTSGKIEWFPDNIKGGARKKVLEGLIKRDLIATAGDDWLVAAEGYNALGLKAPQPEEPAPEAEPARKTPRTRENSKQAQVIAMLRHPEGTTIAEICTATGWQAHTVRGAFAGTFKKRLGLTIVSEKSVGSERVYRIETEDGDQSA
ncbi:DUF3489 domain-containing protein [Ralstonia solanacearum]|uniref:DUF3489 domain-containing protein n=1 Tax=Ralstonia solanacearum TaxID=305 RepID=A0A0S4X2H4_RALSL|nr:MULTISPECIES: DUF3489 domain-containing protein [unclassified Ralstonia]APF85489.1 hypothetical protein BCR16_01060 [Ralstonia solanacearum FJAT-1458]QKL69982.1 DUF3489 domain-containing protein [Ralstonia solanacearum]QKL75194.1 DUF3489 domain-containing protein [Ralstonia solanacearum]QKL80397.1 DUF3489 domain-containing protein [Ralstonia solanacearum]QKL85610.1 DUF3489 domain-containing protein [Ralstonia solanacearum]